MKQTGIKIYSDVILKNPSFIKSIQELIELQQLSFIEVYALPNSSKETAPQYRKAFKHIPVYVHAPHHGHGFDPSNPDKQKTNQALYDEARRFADIVHSTQIVAHPGIGDSDTALDEAARQLSILNQGDHRMLIENMPPYTDEVRQDQLNGCYPLDMIYLLHAAKADFLLDLGHAMCVTSLLKVDPLAYIKQFTHLNPVRIHVQDGDSSNVYDNHMHLGQGNYPLHQLLSLFEDVPLTIETGESSPTSIHPFLSDIEFLK